MFDGNNLHNLDRDTYYNFSLLCCWEAENTFWFIERITILKLSCWCPCLISLKQTRVIISSVTFFHLFKVDIFHLKLTSHRALYYLCSADLSKSFSQLIISIFIISQYFPQKILHDRKVRGYSTLVISWFFYFKDVGRKEITFYIHLSLY